MKTSTLDHLLLAALCLLITACGTDISESLDDDADAGDADFSTFVAVGDSLTAGYADGALYRDGQENSFPAILAQQFALAGGGAFTQPLMPVGATGKLSLTGSTEIGNLTNDRLVLGTTGDPESPAAPVTISPTQTTSIDTRVGNGGFNNLGVPGAKFYHSAFPGYGNLSSAVIDAGGANPFFARFSSNDTTASVLTDATARAPTFFVLWMGNNDVLLYAVDGGVGVDQTGNNNVATYGPEDDITDPDVFANGSPGPGLPNYATVVAALKGAGAKGVLINVPDVRTIPYFTTVPFNPIELSQAEADALNMNMIFMNYNNGINAQVPGSISQKEADRRQLKWKKGSNPVFIADDTLTDLTAFGLQSWRLATAKDFVLLPTSSKIGTDAGGGLVWGVSRALEDGDMLTDNEAGFVETARIEYNKVIKSVAAADDDLAFLDASALLVELNESGIVYGSGGVSSTFAEGGFFSLDGIHPTARGNAVIANEIMRVIEDSFDAKLPPVNPSDYPAVFYQ